MEHALDEICFTGKRRGNTLCTVFPPLLSSSMKKFLEIFSLAGGIGLFVDATDQEAKAFYEQLGLVPLTSNELELFLPVATIHEALTKEG